MQNRKFKEDVLKLISLDKLEEAIEFCMNSFDVKETHYEEIVIISGNLQKWRSDNRKGLNPANEDLNQIRVSIIELVNDYLLFNPRKNIPIEIKQPQKENLNLKRKERENTDYQSLIREKAKREYPTDFEMQKYTIEQQMNAFRKLKSNQPEGIPNEVFESIRDKAKSEYPTDFEMREYTENQQVEAYKKIQSKKPNDIPTNIWEQIRKKARSEYPTDFEMQKYIEEKQITSIRNLRQIQPHDIPNEIFKIIYDKAKREYSTDFEMQEYVINQQIIAYKELNGS